jgi:hypothetical protein
MAPLSARQDVTVTPIRHNPEGGIMGGLMHEGRVIAFGVAEAVGGEFATLA